MDKFRKMRRIRQELGKDACLEIINRATSGVLSVIGDEGYPYGVPLGYVFVPGDEQAGEPEADSTAGEPDDMPAGEPADVPAAPAKFFFHCAKKGHKLDAIRACDKVCFTIIDRDDVVADEFTTYYRSVVCFGRAKILDTPEEIIPALKLLADRYSPDESEEKKNCEISKQLPALVMIEFDVEHMTGKEAIELVRKREKYEHQR